jgi:hypothetical protein
VGFESTDGSLAEDTNILSTVEEHDCSSGVNDLRRSYLDPFDVFCSELNVDL